jgi:RNA polymerase sigma-70 factor (ECF subfamily)
LAALEVWPRKGIPENPIAWLYLVAKNKAKNHLSRKTVFKRKVLPGIEIDSEVISEITIDLSDNNITDSQLQMLFAICNPGISIEAQIGLALRILCGFGINEIADAFLSTKETINKRLYRAREKLRRTNMPIEVPSETEIDKRLETVLTTLYLLFNEGYYSESRDTVLRRDLCLEAMRLTRLLVENEFTSRPSADALLALMCFHSSRFDARLNEREEPVLYQDQDETLWNLELITYGGYYLNRASRGSKISKYHLEAGIAYWHTIKADTAEKWETILGLFDQLLCLEYSPIAALNRTYALSKVKGKAAAIEEAEKLGLTDNPFYHTLLGELYTDLDNQKAMVCFQKALSLAKTITDKKLIQNRIDNL